MDILKKTLLASAQYVNSPDTSTDSGKGFSGNLEGRLGDEHQYKAFVRYDKWTPKVTLNDNEYATGTTNPHSTAYMLTTQIDF